MTKANKRDAVPLWAATKCRMTRFIFAKLKGDHGRVIKAMLDCLHYCDTGICEGSYEEIATLARQPIDRCRIHKGGKEGEIVARHWNPFRRTQ